MDYQIGTVCRWALCTALSGALAAALPLGPPAVLAHGITLRGQIVSAGPYYVELVVKRDHLEIYPLDARQDRLPLKGITGKAVVQTGAKVTNLPLKAVYSALRADFAAEKVRTFKVAAHIRIADTDVVARFVYPPPRRAPIPPPAPVEEDE